ncbi:MAG: aminodeoxychorismate synthase component I [Myxococcota bacterium]
MIARHRRVPIQLRYPFWRYLQLFRGPGRFLLDSAKDPERLGRWSFLGGEPHTLFLARMTPGQDPARGAAVEIHRFGEAPSVAHTVEDPFAALEATLGSFAMAPGDPEDPPLRAGAVGYISYEARAYLERLPRQAQDDLGLPILAFALVDWILVRDERTDRAWISAVGRGPDHPQAERALQAEIQRARACLAAFDAEPLPPLPLLPVPRPIAVRPGFDAAGYREQVEQVQEHIRAGDVFEVCLTQRMEAPAPRDPWALYAALRQENPAPFAGYFELEELSLVSASPERFLRLDRQRRAQSRPIKGTRARAAEATADRAAAEDLGRSEKDRAEHLMIVDLVRSDLGRVCAVGSVEVPELCRIEAYATVFQMVSTVQGRLRPERSAIDLIRACFPGGSMTGAPKIEAMKIIDALEPVARGPYAGAFGFIDFDQSFDLSMVIRTLVLAQGRATFGVGGAVVLDSDPAAEHQESLDKARASIAALGRVPEEPR